MLHSSTLPSPPLVNHLYPRRNSVTVASSSPTASPLSLLLLRHPPLPVSGVPSSPLSPVLLVSGAPSSPRSSPSSTSSPSLLVHHHLPAFLPSSPFLRCRRLTVSSPVLSSSSDVVRPLLAGHLHRRR
ncbi:hypothetical protein PIB30_052715, partial [Stylosanthes scabra]|nr:hypothetical protein [Stylosanthes scabra]